MKLIILIFALLCLWLKLAMGVVVNGILQFQPNGAVFYTLWKSPPGSTRIEYVGAFTNPPYVVQGAIADGTTFYVKGVYKFDTNYCCIESDYGFVVTPPVTNGTNRLRFFGPVNALALQSTMGDAAQWTTIGLFTNTPLSLEMRRQQMFRTFKTNLPPLP